jgi:hypothetical protein
MPLSAALPGNPGDRRRYTARFRNAVERAGEGRCEYDDPVAAPCAAKTAEGSFAQNPHGPAPYINRVQLSASE